MQLVVNSVAGEEAHAKLLRGAAMYRARAGQHKEAAAAYKVQRFHFHSPFMSL
jgi:hypothetical protein